MSTPSRFNSRPVMTLLTAAILLAAAPPMPAMALPPTQKTSKSSSKKSSSGKKSSGKKSAKTSKTSATSKTSKSSAPQSSAEARRQQEEARREIQRTEEQIRLNEKQVKEGLSDLDRLQSEIQTGKTKVSRLEGEVSSLTKEMDGLSADIDSNEKDLARMRAEYLKAVKKMRLTKKNQSSLAFIFSSESFNQALRRVRYLRQFSDWKEKKTNDIDAKIETLRKENERLAQVRARQTAALGQLQASQKSLEDRHRRQGEIVAGLRRNGDVLQAHLSAKQAEANRLGQSISALIAQEQAKADAERKERERKAAEKAAAEKAAADKARREREAAERAAAEKAAADKAAAEKTAADAKKAESERKAAEKKEMEDRKAAEKKAQEDRKAAEKEAQEQKKAVEKRAKEANEAARKSAEKKTKNSEKGSRKKGRAKDKNTYVEVEKVESPAGKSDRSDRSDKFDTSNPSAASAAAKSDFAASKGSLPRPVDGSWRVTNPFGRHAMPGLPDVEYDNPGIDAEVSKGATAKAVYAGKVSGVYKLAGYGTVVIVNHGDYYTVYGNLTSSNVAVGSQVKAGQAIGGVAADPDDPRRSSIHFEVWRGREKLNPSSWIK